MQNIFGCSGLHVESRDVAHITKKTIPKFTGVDDVNTEPCLQNMSSLNRQNWIFMTMPYIYMTPDYSSGSQFCICIIKISMYCNIFFVEENYSSILQINLIYKLAAIILIYSNNKEWYISDWDENLHQYKSCPWAISVTGVISGKSQTKYPLSNQP